MTTRFFSTYNGSLPKLSPDVLGDLISAIKSALITGYAGKDGAGWELVYESLNNSADTTKRIVVRSKAVDSERKYFQIEDINAEEGKITMSAAWDSVNLKPLEIHATSKLIKAPGASLNPNYAVFAIIADEKSVWIQARLTLTFFGDYRSFNSRYSKTLMSIKSDNTLSASVIPSSLSAPNSSSIVDADGANYLLRAYSPVNSSGWGQSSSTTVPHPDTNHSWNVTPASDDFTKQREGDPLYVRPVELLYKISTGGFAVAGEIPHLVYVDGRPNNTDSVFIDGREMIFIHLFNRATGYIYFVVDK